MVIRSERSEHVETVTIARPEALNSVDDEHARRLLDLVVAASRDDQVRAILIRGEGDRAFCTGADVSQFHDALANGNVSDVVAAVSGSMNALLSCIVSAPKPVVAAMNGVTAGGGLGLALACDVRIASQTARFLPAFMNVGVSPDGGTTWLLPRTVGWARARELLLTNRVLDSRTALDWGLVSEVVPSAEVDGRAHEVAATLARSPRPTIGWAKERLSRELPLEDHLEWEREATVASAKTEAFAEGIRAFHQKRRPEFG